MKPITIDINADLGEGMGNDAAIMPYISSCNIASGGHYGDAYTIREAIQLAKQYRVQIGVHPSYPDIENFGRKSLQISTSALTETIIEQIALFQEVSVAENTPIHHIKLHGALYNDAAIDADIANAVMQAILKFKNYKRLKLYAPFNSVLYHKAKKDVTVVCEAFIDRRYTDALHLVNRKEANALIETPQLAWEQLQNLLFKEQVVSSTGRVKKIQAQTYCIHGDHINAVEILRYLRRQMETHHILLANASA